MSTAQQPPAAHYESVIHSKHRDKWLRARLEGVGASEVAGLLGHGRSPMELFALKTGHLEPDSLEDVERVHWGNVLEPIVLREYASGRYANRLARRNGWLVRSTVHPWAMCTIDGWTNHPEYGLIPLEIKTADKWLEDDWLDGAPPKYHWQLVHQMVVTGAPAASVACLIGGNKLVWDDVERTSADVNKILDAGAEFWDRVQSNRPPDFIDGSPSTRRALAALYPSHMDGKVLTLEGRDYVDMDAELARVKDQLKALAKRKDELENQFRAAMGDAETAFLNDGTRLTLKTQTRKEHMVKASSFRVLRRKAPSNG